MNELKTAEGLKQDRSILFFFFLVVLGFELKTLCLLGRHFTTRAMPPTLFALVIFQIGSLLFAGIWSQTTILLHLTPK
jgi:hypothetical protein